MNKSQFYLSECAEVASKSPMCFKLGAIMVKGGKVLSTGYNHHRTHYDGSEVSKHGHRKPVSMHAEMHAILNATGMTPSFKTQVQGVERRFKQCFTGPAGPPTRRKPTTAKRNADPVDVVPHSSSKGVTGSQWRLSRARRDKLSSKAQAREEIQEVSYGCTDLAWREQR